MEEISRRIHFHAASNYFTTDTVHFHFNLNLATWIFFFFMFFLYCFALVPLIELLTQCWREETVFDENRSVSQVRIFKLCPYIVFQFQVILIISNMLSRHTYLIWGCAHIKNQHKPRNSTEILSSYTPMWFTRACFDISCSSTLRSHANACNDESKPRVNQNGKLNFV